VLRVESKSRFHCLISRRLRHHRIFPKWI